MGRTTTALPCAKNGAAPNPQGNPGLVADCTALLAAKGMLAGGATLNWDDDRPIAEWEGITVGATPRRVLTLDLSERELTGSIPPELGTLTNLRSLLLHNNQLIGPIPPELGTLANLSTLWLHNNRLAGPIPAELGMLASLEELLLANNQLIGPIPAELGTLTDLRQLALAGNALTGPIPAGLGALASLQMLALDNNRLTGATCSSSPQSSVRSPTWRC